MGATEFVKGASLAEQTWAKDLAIEAAKKQYFSKFMGAGPSNIIQVRKDLNKGAGEKITYGLRMRLTGGGVEGDNVIEGTGAEEALVFHSDYLFIDQRRKGTKSKGKMSEQRVAYNIRKESRDALSTWFAEDYDEMLFMYLSGARGVNADFHEPTSFTGRAFNSFDTPDSSHLIINSGAGTKADLDSADGMTLPIVERLVAHAETTDPMIQPISVNGEKKWVLVMHTFQAHAMRTSTSTNDWMDITKAAANGKGDGARFYSNSLGEYADVILHKHRNVIRFSDYGSGANVNAARALFLGAQAGVIAWGGEAGPNRYSWNEETDDRGNSVVITAGTIYGCKKTRFNSKDFGVIALDTYVNTAL